VQRGRARLILGRFHDRVLSPGDPTATTREPDSASHESHTFLLSRHWARYRNAGGFGWRGGSCV
jgi:hypothetical protein